jgi:hypothetical protein
MADGASTGIPRMIGDWTLRLAPCGLFGKAERPLPFARPLGENAAWLCLAVGGRNDRHKPSIRASRRNRVKRSSFAEVCKCFCSLLQRRRASGWRMSADAGLASDDATLQGRPVFSALVAPDLLNNRQLKSAIFAILLVNGVIALN